MNLYIHSAGILSAAGNNSEENFLQNSPEPQEELLLCKEPDYSAYIPAMQLRRMSKAVRMGIGASKIALQKAALEKPDALSVGTALGCLNDTEVFLSKMVAQEEQMLTPTAFIQSTHNTVAGQIALLHQCNGHNLTFVHRGHSFEHAVLNAWLYLNEHAAATILVGGIDELTPTTHAVLQRFGITKNAEGASFFVANKNPDAAQLCIKDLQTFTTQDANDVKNEINLFLKRNELTSAEIDLVLLGIDEASKTAYQALQQDVFSHQAQVSFKNICGNYSTASAFALGFLATALQQGFPENTILNHAPQKLQNMVMINNYIDSWSIWYLQA
jgi:hypothetical protein